jgi:hypothetical protein
MPSQNEVLASFKFGQFGNYGSKLAVEIKDDGVMPVLSLENWAYGETTAVVSTYGVSSKDLADLGKQLIQAALKLEEREKANK